MCVYGKVPGKQWKTSNNRSLLEFQSQPCSIVVVVILLCLQKCWRLKYRTLWQWLLLRAWLWDFFWLADCEWSFINEWIWGSGAVVVLAATKCFAFCVRCVGLNRRLSIQGLSFPVHSSRFLFALSPWTKIFFFQNAHMSCLLYASTYICAHVRTPCSLPPQSLFLPLHAPYPSIQLSLKPPHWPLPSNRMIIWHNVTPPDAWWGM